MGLKDFEVAMKNFGIKKAPPIPLYLSLGQHKTHLSYHTMNFSFSSFHHAHLNISRAHSHNDNTEEEYITMKCFLYKIKCL
jgi:hypothetical protein